MSNPGRAANGGGPDPRAEYATPRGKGRHPSPGASSADPAAARYADPEAALGGADAVEKTTYVVGKGGEPDTRRGGDYSPRRATDGPNLAAWIVGGIAALIALVYAIGAFA